MIEFLAGLLYGGLTLYGIGREEHIADKNKMEAIKNGRKTYWDGVGATFRSVDTNEIVVHRMMNGKDEDIGIKTHKVYNCYDKKQEKEQQYENIYDKKNKELSESNQYFRWKRMPDWDSLDGKSQVTYAQFDNMNGKPIWNIKKSMEDGLYHIIYAHPHYKMNNFFVIDGHAVKDERTISDEEYSHYKMVINETER